MLHSVVLPGGGLLFPGGSLAPCAMVRQAGWVSMTSSSVFCLPDWPAVFFKFSYDQEKNQPLLLRGKTGLQGKSGKKMDNRFISFHY
jgi:hypothetical protein